MHLRPHAVSAGSVACRVVDSPVGTLAAHSCHALGSHGSPHNAAVPGLEVSRGDVLQHQLIQAQLCHQPLQLRVLLLQILQPPCLVHPQTAILFTPPEVGLLHDSRFLACLWRRLSVRHGYFDLPQQVHNLFCTILLASRHLPLLLFQFVSPPLAQFEPGTPDAFGHDPTNLILDISSYFAQCTICTETGWAGQVVCAKTVTGPNYRNNETQTWTVVPGIPQQPTGQTLYPTQWKSTGSGSTASQTWVINASGTGQLTVFANGSGINFARYNSQIVVFNGYQSTPPPDYTDYEYQWLPFGNSDPNAQHVQGSSTTTSSVCDSPVQPGGSSCTVTCSWNFNKQ